VLPDRRATTRAARAAQVVTGLASVGWVGLAALLVRDDRLAAGAVLIAAMAWGCAPFVLATLTETRRPEPRPLRAARSLTTVIRVGGEPDDVARTTILLAAGSGPVAVVTTTPRPVLDELAGSGVQVFVATTVEQAVHDAACIIDTDAVLVVSASALPDVAAATRAARRLGDGVGWVVGRVTTFNRDGYAPDGREVLGRRLRAAARSAGLVTWEPDATVVRTDLLRREPIAAGRPWGAWLRARARQGLAGAVDDGVLARRAAPVGADTFWPATIPRQRAAAADLADATTSGPVRARVLAAGLLLRELHGVPVVVWSTSPLLVSASGGFPFRGGIGVVLGVQCVLAGARWACLRVRHRVALHPVADVAAAVYDLPGSLLALQGAVTRRVPTRHRRVPDRPLVWAALLLLPVTAIPLIDQAGATGATAGAGAVLALVNLLLLWMFAIRAIAQWRWVRTSYRIPLHLDVTVDGRGGTTVDGSFAGLAVVGPFADVASSSAVAVSIALADGTTLDAGARVVAARTAGDRCVLGLSLDVGAPDQERWARQLAVVAGDTAGASVPGVGAPERSIATERAVGRRRAARALDVVALACAGALSLVAVAVLALILLGYRPLVVRSASMTPTLGVGDVVLEEWIHASDVRVGDIVTFDDPTGSGETVTHRVVARTERGGVVDVQTRGDANTTTEQWTAASDLRIGRVAWSVPAVGAVVTRLRTEAVRFALVGGGIVVALAATRGLVRPRRRSRPALEPVAGGA
jgi:signal peptidase I